MWDNNLNTWKLAAAVSAACVSGVLAGLALNGLKSKAPEAAPQKWIRVGSVKELIVYPIKSCKGVNISEASATKIGLKASDFLRDRIFMVVDSRYVFQTQRTVPRMVLIEVTVNGNQLTLNGPGMASITFDVPDDKQENRKSCRIFDDHIRQALDCGNEVGKWLDTFLEKTGLRLVYHNLENTQRTLSPLQKKFPNFVPAHNGAFQDQTSFMMIAEASVKELNTHLEIPVTHRNFRPTIYIEETAEAFAEDLWTFIRIGKEGGPIFKTSKPCTRCKMTTVNPELGVFNQQGEPLKTLTTIKRKYGDDRVNELVKTNAVMGLQMGLFSAGNQIRVGDSVYAGAV